MRRFVLVISAGMAVAIAAPARSDDFYARKTITMIIGGNPGGGYDLYARALMRHYARHIPGEPNIIGQNSPGAGSLNLANHMYTRASKDGLTIGMPFPGVIVGPLLDERMNATFKPSEFRYVGSANVSTRVCATYHTSQTRTFEDALARETVMGGDAPGGSLFDYANFLRNEVGAKFKVIRGYKGSVDITLSMERGEVEGICGLDWSSLRSQKPHWVKDKLMHVDPAGRARRARGAREGRRPDAMEIREGQGYARGAGADREPAGVRPAVPGAAGHARRPRRPSCARPSTPPCKTRRSSPTPPKWARYRAGVRAAGAGRGGETLRRARAIVMRARKALMP